jgi:hypothetical protein
MSSSADVTWVREWRDGSHWQLRVGRDGSRLVAEWAGLGALRVGADGVDPIVTVAEDVEPVEERRWREGPLRALLRHLEGRPTLHASAVAMGGNALLFLGESGAGKSTCAADLCARVGGQLLADDLAEIEILRDRVIVTPTAHHHWLLADSAFALGHPTPRRSKDAVLAARVAAAPCRVAGIIVLAFGHEASPVMAAVRGQSAFSAINAAYARFVVDDAGSQLRDLDFIGKIAASVPVYTLTRPRSFAALGEAAELIIRLATGTPHGLGSEAM